MKSNLFFISAIISLSLIKIFPNEGKAQADVCKVTRDIFDGDGGSSGSNSVKTSDGGKTIAASLIANAKPKEVAHVPSPNFKQNDPADIPRMLEPILDGQADVVCGWRRRRRHRSPRTAVARGGAHSRHPGARDLRRELLGPPPKRASSASPAWHRRRPPRMRLAAVGVHDRPGCVPPPTR